MDNQELRPPQDRAEPTPRELTDRVFRVIIGRGCYPHGPYGPLDDVQYDALVEAVRRELSAALEVAAPAAAPDAGAPQESAGTKTNDDEMLYFLAAYYQAPDRATLLRCWPERTLDEIDLLRAWETRQPKSAPAAHQEGTEPTDLFRLAGEVLRRGARPDKCHDDIRAYTYAEVLDAMVAFASELGAPARAAEWQPIENAPTDFGWMFGWDGQSMHMVCRLDGKHLAIVIDHITSQPALIEWPMTHWRPLPLPPCALTGRSNSKT